jgi:hypothetical protein
MTFAEILAYGTGSWHLHRSECDTWKRLGRYVCQDILEGNQANRCNDEAQIGKRDPGFRWITYRSSRECAFLWNVGFIDLGSEVGFGEKPSLFLLMGKFAGQRLNVKDEHRRRLHADQRPPIADHCTPLAKEGLAVNPVWHWYMFVYSPCAC